MAQCTVFGWMLYGNVPLTEAYTERFVSHQLLCMNVLDQSFKAFWELESVGNPAHEESVSCDPTLLKFQEEIKIVDDRYEVALPWKQGFCDKLLNNEKLARSRLSHLSKKLGRDPVLETRYNKAIKDMWDNGIIEDVPREESMGCGPVFYMPHRSVIRESSVSTKVRPVFDRSAKGFNILSLNDCIEVGPCLLSNLTKILLSFRRWQIAITSDIEKAFLQIGVKKDDCDVHRFLWDVNGTTKVMRFARVPFGNCSSPFLLNATVQFHLSGFPESRGVEGKHVCRRLFVWCWFCWRMSYDGEGCNQYHVAGQHAFSEVGVQQSRGCWDIASGLQGQVSQLWVFQGSGRVVACVWWLFPFQGFCLGIGFVHNQESWPEICCPICVAG